ncbi:hypothetical protein FEM08_02940 [Flavobacterium gilvum]|nr:hypothetical protein FEM08_02940 [Flavobacterium gilvum]
MNGTLLPIVLISLQKNQIFTTMKPPFLPVSILYGLYLK